MRRFVLVIAVAVLAATGLVAAPSDAVPGVVRLNQMQVIGTHNSYHLEPTGKKLEIMLGFDPQAIELVYSHSPLPDQFDHEGVRQIELDVFADPAGDLWRPTGRAGWKVFHIEQLDMDATCAVLVDCLGQIKAWSDAHPRHLPIAVLLEVKDDADVPTAPNPVPVTPALLHTLDDELRSVFPPERLLTPDDVRGGHASVEEAILTDGWPRIDDVRGRTMFLLDNRRDQYVDGDPTLAGRVAFPPSTPGQPDAAFVKRNDPTGANLAEIQSLVQAGYVVRTRADSPVVTPQACDTSQRDAALASGAQWVSTDYPVAGLADRWGCPYVASIPGGTPARCNPVNAPPGCVSTDVEDLVAHTAPAPAPAPTPGPTPGPPPVPTGPPPEPGPAPAPAATVPTPVAAVPRVVG